MGHPPYSYHDSFKVHGEFRGFPGAAHDNRLTDCLDAPVAFRALSEVHAHPDSRPPRIKPPKRLTMGANSRRLSSPTTHIRLGGSCTDNPGFDTSATDPERLATPFTGTCTVWLPSWRRYRHALGPVFQKPAFVGFSLSEPFSRSGTVFLFGKTRLSCRSIRRLQRLFSAASRADFD